MTSLAGGNGAMLIALVVVACDNLTAPPPTVVTAEGRSPDNAAASDQPNTPPDNNLSPAPASVGVPVAPKLIPENREPRAAEAAPAEACCGAASCKLIPGGCGCSRGKPPAAGCGG